MSSLYILGSCPLLDICFTNIFCQSVVCLVILLIEQYCFNGPHRITQSILKDTDSLGPQIMI